jgi:hypothetical protein
MGFAGVLPPFAPTPEQENRYRSEMINLLYNWNCRLRDEMKVFTVENVFLSRTVKVAAMKA